MRHKQKIRLLAASSIGIACAGPAQQGPEPVPPREAAVAEVAAAPILPSIDSILKGMSVRQKIGQLIMPWMLGDYQSRDADAFLRAATWIDSLEVGGIIVSIGSPLDAAAKLNALQRRSELPLLIAADLEWGSGMRLIGGTSFPMPMALGATGRELDAYQLGRVTAIEARAVGIHMTFSPVADVNNNPDNPIINTRSFGENPHEISRLLTAYIRGAHDHGLYTTAKHFPGHGDTQTDSHIDVPVVAACWNRLDSLELIPFRAAIAARVTAVMTAHLALPCVDGDANPPPATLSPTVMTGILRDSLQFEGLLVTDALTMGAIVSKYGPGEAVVQAFLAGSDLLLIPADPKLALDAMVQAVDDERIPMDRLDTSVRRMLTLKRDAGLFEHRTVVLDSIPAVVNQHQFQEVANDIAARSLTLVQEGPLASFRTQRSRTAVILYAEETNLTVGNDLIAELRAEMETVNPFRLYPASGKMSYDSARAVIDDNPRVIFATAVRFIAGRGHVQMPDSLAALTLETAARKPTVLVSLGSPYLLNQIPGYNGAYMIAWSDFKATELAAARALAGKASITGRLPITLSDKYPRGFGLTVP